MPRFLVPLYVEVESDTAEDARSYVASNYVVCNVGTDELEENITNVIVPRYVDQAQEIKED
jgi:hypothetical protein